MVERLEDMSGDVKPLSDEQWEQVIKELETCSTDRCIKIANKAKEVTNKLKEKHKITKLEERGRLTHDLIKVMETEKCVGFNMSIGFFNDVNSRILCRIEPVHDQHERHEILSNISEEIKKLQNTMI